MLEIGTKAPNFSLKDDNGEVRTLDEFKGKKVILYFYPKDNTPGCTKQACGFRDLYPQIEEKDAVVIGINKDSVESHKKFKEKHDLPFILLSDPDLEVVKAYDVWKEKKIFGKTGFGIERSTYLIDEKGNIEKAFNKVKASENPNDMLKEI
ncbi:peroxiredoxin Q/BCP [Peptoniphilus olsenii]|uniref:thioredoxin-dependent peroxiredoxin n=1 Tax=Peptoniphilus olsenii TaxID=411570 RepID=A0ABV2JBI9_9FIRM